MAKSNEPGCWDDCDRDLTLFAHAFLAPDEPMRGESQIRPNHIAGTLRPFWYFVGIKVSTATFKARARTTSSQSVT